MFNYKQLIGTLNIQHRKYTVNWFHKKMTTPAQSPTRSSHSGSNGLILLQISQSIAFLKIMNIADISLIKTCSAPVRITAAHVLAVIDDY